MKLIVRHINQYTLALNQRFSNTVSEFQNDVLDYVQRIYIDVSF